MIFLALVDAFAATNPWDTFVQSLAEDKITGPDERTMTKLRNNFSTQVLLTANSPEAAGDLYRQVKALPATLTLAALSQNNRLAVNGPLNLERPYILTASDSMTGEMLMVKILRYNPDMFNVTKTQQNTLHVREKTVNDLVKDRIGFVPATVVSVKVAVEEGHHVGSSAGDFTALRMPRYTTTLADAPTVGGTVMMTGASRMVNCLNYLHSLRWCHMDVKSANIFIDSAGSWFLGDFGSSTPTGETVYSCTDAFYMHAVIGAAAAPKYDWYMLAVLLCIESCEPKHNYATLLFTNARADDAKIRTHASNSTLPTGLSCLLTALLRCHDDEQDFCEWPPA